MRKRLKGLGVHKKPMKLDSKQLKDAEDLAKAVKSKDPMRWNCISNALTMLKYRACAKRFNCPVRRERRMSENWYAK